MTDPAKPDAVATAQGLTDALKEMSGELRRLDRYGRVNRRLAVTAIVSLALIACLTAAVAVVAVQAHTNGIRAETAISGAQRAYASNQALCQASNVARGQQIQLWDYLLSLSTKPRTAEGQKVVGEFEAHLHILFAPRNCAALGTGR